MQDAKHSSGWISILIKAMVFCVILIISDFLIVFLLGSQIWSNLGYLFGSDLRTTFVVLMFIEGGVLLASGSLWSVGSSKNVSYGIYRKQYGGFSKEDWEAQEKQTENPGDVVKVLLLVGGFAFVASFVLLLV